MQILREERIPTSPTNTNPNYPHLLPLFQKVPYIPHIFSEYIPEYHRPMWSWLDTLRFQHTRASRERTTINTNSNPVTTNPKARATPAAAEGPRQGDVLFHPRVRHEHGDGGTGVCGGGATGSLSCRDSLGCPGPAPSNPALVLSLAARQEFKPQPTPPSFLRVFLRISGGVSRHGR